MLRLSFLYHRFENVIITFLFFFNHDRLGLNRYRLFKLVLRLNDGFELVTHVFGINVKVVSDYVRTSAVDFLKLTPDLVVYTTVIFVQY